MTDRRVLYTALSISLLIHLLFGVVALMITVMVSQDVPEYMELSFGQPELTRPLPPTVDQPKPSVTEAQPVENTTPPPKTEPRPEPKPAQPKPQPQQTAALKKVETTPVKVDPAPAEPQPDEVIHSTQPKKFDPSMRFQQQQSESKTPAFNQLDTDKQVATMDKSTDLSTPATNSTANTDKGQLIASSADEKETSGVPGESNRQTGPTVPIGNTNLPVEIDIDMKGRDVLYREFKTRQEITREGFVEFKIVIGADGSVTDVSLVKRGDPAAEAAGFEWIKKWKFTPNENVETQEGRVKIYTKLQ